MHAAGADRLPNTLSLAFPGVTAPGLVAALTDVAISAGAACHGDGSVGSAVLAAMGVAPELARGTVRISLGRGTQAADIPRAAAAIALAVAAAHGA